MSTSLAGPPERGEPRSFEPALLAGAIEEEITAPRREAQALVDRHPFTTRLSTTMRAEDMTIDPVFELDADLPNLPRLRTATLWSRCSEEYYEGYAPTELEVNGALFPVSAGQTMSEDEACRRLGGTHDAGGCSAAVNSQASSFVILTALGLFAMTLYRRKQARG